MALPTITIKGRLTRDPELRWTNDGKPVAGFDVACSKDFFNKQTNQWDRVGDTLYMHCQIWEGKAEDFTETARKGSEVLIVGELQANNWTDKQGQPHRDVRVRVKDVALTPTRQGGQQSGWGDGGSWADQQPTQQAPAQQAPNQQANNSQQTPQQAQGNVWDEEQPPF